MPKPYPVAPNYWRCCDCKGFSLWALHPLGSFCSQCQKHRNNGCCKAVYSEVDRSVQTSSPGRRTFWSTHLKRAPVSRPAFGRDNPGADFAAALDKDDGKGSPPKAIRTEGSGPGDQNAARDVPLQPHLEFETYEGAVLSDLETEGAMERINLKSGMTAQQNVSSRENPLPASQTQHSLDTEHMLDEPIKEPSRHQSMQGTDSIQSRLQIWSSRLMSRALEPRLQPDKIRVRYRCSCGTHVWDDYPVKLAEQALELEAQLRKLAQQAETNPASARNAAGSPAKSSILADLKSVFDGLKRRLLRQDARQRVDDECQRCSQSTPASESDSSAYYLTCFPESNDRRPVLSQIAGTTITGDHAYFSMLRVEARKYQCLWSRFLMPRKIKAIRYVQLHLLHDNRHANVKEGAMPEFPIDRAVYSPVKPDFEIAKPMYMGSRILLHYFEKTHDCCQHPHILPSIPKKLKGKLLVAGEDGPALGWGMLLEDGIDTLRVGIAGIAGLLVSTAIGITYAKLLGDVQGGSGITQCLMYFVTFIVALHGVVEIR